MSEVKLIVRDRDAEICGTMHGSVADRVVAALSADPETIAELEQAYIRFLRSDEWQPGKCPHSESLLRRQLWSRYDDEPYDAGLIVIDLAARLVVVDSTYSSPGKRGSVDDPSMRKNHFLGEPIFYHLADEWRFVYRPDSWRPLAQARREARHQHPPLDVRPVLFGDPLLEFIVQGCHAIFQWPPIGASQSEEDVPTRESISLKLALEHPEQESNYSALQWYDEAFRQVHENWLLTPRCDLQHRSPRDVLVEKNHHIAMDLQDRYQQWAVMGRCPPPISTASHAWRFAGLGTAEIVIYYNLVRFLLQKCWEDLEREAETTNTNVVPDSFVRTEMASLALARDEWLATPHPNFYRIPPQVFIDRERQRIPMTASNVDMLPECECPLCPAIDSGAPMLLGLDGSEMDDGFAFDFRCRDLAEWEAEQSRLQAIDEVAAIRDEVEEELGLPDLDLATLGENFGSNVADDPDNDLEVDWEGNSDDYFDTAYGSETSQSSEPPSTVRPQLTWLIEIGTDLAAVIVLLRGPGNRFHQIRSPQIQSLMEPFANLRAAVSESSEPVSSQWWAPLKAKLGDALQRVSGEVPETAAACAAVMEQLNHPKLPSW